MNSNLQLAPFNPRAAQRGMVNPGQRQVLRRPQDYIPWIAAGLGPPSPIVKTRRGAQRYLIADTAVGPFRMRIRAAREDMPLLFEKMRASGSRRVDLSAEFQPFYRTYRCPIFFELATQWVISAMSRMEQYRPGGEWMRVPQAWEHFQDMIDEARYHFRTGNVNDADDEIENGIELFRKCTIVMSQFGFGYGSGLYTMLMDVARRFVPFLGNHPDLMFELLGAVYDMTSQDLYTLGTLLEHLTPVAEDELFYYAWQVFHNQGIAGNDILADRVMELLST